MSNTYIACIHKFNLYHLEEIDHVPLGWSRKLNHKYPCSLMIGIGGPFAGIFRYIQFHY